MPRRKKQKEKADDVPYVESFERLTGIEPQRTFLDPNTGASRRIYSDAEALAICQRLIDGEPQSGDCEAFSNIEAGATYYSDQVQALSYEASAALILALPGAADWLQRVAAEGLEAVCEADRQASQINQAADAEPTEDELWAARFRQGSEIIASCGEGAKRKHIIESLLRGGFSCAEVVKISGVPYQSTYAIRNALAAEYLRKRLPVPENLKLRRIGQYTPITPAMGKTEKRKAMDKNLLLAAGDAGQAARAIPDPNRKKKKAFGEGPGLINARREHADR